MPPTLIVVFLLALAIATAQTPADKTANSREIPCEERRFAEPFPILSRPPLTPAHAIRTLQPPLTKLENR